MPKCLIFVRGQRETPKEISIEIYKGCVRRTDLKHRRAPNLKQVDWLDCGYLLAAWVASRRLNLSGRLSQFTNTTVAASDDRQKDIKACLREVRRAAGAPDGLSIGRITGHGRCVWPSGSQLCQQQDLCVPCGFVERRSPNRDD